MTAAILVAIPHDGAALFVYALIAFCVVLVWRASRRPTDAAAIEQRPSDVTSETPARARRR